MSPDELKSLIPGGLLSFPLTDFDANDEFDAKASAKRLEWLLPLQDRGDVRGGRSGRIFLADRGGIFSGRADSRRDRQEGAFRSLALRATARATRSGMRRKPNGSAPTASFCCRPIWSKARKRDCARISRPSASATKLGVIVYNRGNCRLQAETLARIAQDCPNLIGFKDGVGDVEQIVAVRRLLGDRVVMLNGMPTAETYARPFRALGMATYSSAIFNFVPRTALDFHRAVHSGDDAGHRPAHE